MIDTVRDSLLTRAEALEDFKTRPPCERCGKHHAFTKEDYDEIIARNAKLLQEAIDDLIVTEVMTKVMTDASHT